jgi:hypothetical protein
LFEVIFYSSGICNFILALFGLIWFRIPFLAYKDKYRRRFSIASAFSLFECLLSGYFSAYLIIQTKLLDLGFGIPLFLASIFHVPILYEGTVFSSDAEISLFVYFRLLLEHFGTVAFCSVLWSLPYSWVFLIVVLWRLFACCEPFAFWASIQAVVSPFQALEVCKSSRSLLFQYLLILEISVAIYCTAWFMEYRAVNAVFVYGYLAYAVIFAVIEIVRSNAPFTHRVRAIRWGRTEEVDSFENDIL